MKAASAIALALFALGCGVEKIELAPDGDDALLLEAVPNDALTTLRKAPEQKPEPMLTLTYPADRSAIPANLAPVTFLFGGEKKAMEPMKAGGMVRAYELRIASDAGELRVYTVHPSATLPPARWRRLLSAAQGKTLQLTLRALDDRGHVTTSAARELYVLAPSAVSNLAYWSETRESALYGSLELGVEATSTGDGYPSLDPWQAISTDGLAQAVAPAGVLSATYRALPLAVPWADAWHVETPAWSADASSLVFVATPIAMMPMMPAGMGMPMAMPDAAPRASIVRARIAPPGELAAPEPLYTSDKADTLLSAPAYSEDARFIAFAQVKGKDKLSSLAILSAEGGAPLPFPNKLAWKGDGAYPSWLPSSVSGERWLLFCQNRAPGEQKLPAEQLQLWMLALRDAPDGLVAVGEPVWLPLQSADESNVRPLSTAP